MAHDSDGDASRPPPTRRRLPVAPADAPAPPAPTRRPRTDDLRQMLRLGRRFVRSFVNRLAWPDAPYVTSVPTALGVRRREALEGLARRIQAASPAPADWAPEAPGLDPATLRFRAPSGRGLTFEFQRARKDTALRVHGGLGVRYRLDGPAGRGDQAWVLAALEALDAAARAQGDPAAWVRTLTASDAVAVTVYPRDRRVELRPTLACDHHCAFCNSVDRSIENAMHGAADLRASVALWSAFPVFRATVSGGEPTLLKDLPAIVADLAVGGLLVELQTNGMALADPCYARRLREAGLHTALVSLHASHAALSDERITLCPGAWARTVAGVDQALAHGIAVDLSHVIHRANAHDTAAFMGFVRERWGRRVRVRLAFVAPTGAASERAADVVPALPEVLPELRRALALAQSARLRLLLVGYCGIPPCLLAPFEHVSESAYRGRVDVPDDHVKFEACRACVYDAGCPGLWRGYVDAHGDPGVRAVTRAPARVRAVSWLTRRVI